jgi:hypothetical protein
MAISTQQPEYMKYKFYIKYVFLCVLFTTTQQSYAQGYGRADSSQAHRDSIRQLQRFESILLSDSVQMAIAHYLNAAGLALKPKNENLLTSVTHNGQQLAELLAAILGLLVGIPGLVGIIKNGFQPEKQKQFTFKPYLAGLAVVWVIYAFGYFAAVIAETIVVAILCGAALALFLFYLLLQYWKFFDPMASWLPKSGVRIIPVGPDIDMDSNTLSQKIKPFETLLSNIVNRGATANVYLYYDKMASDRPSHLIIECDNTLTKDTISQVLKHYSTTPV